MADYTYPSTLRGVLQSTFSRFELPYTSESQPASGTPFIQIVSDDSSMTFDVSFVFTSQEIAEFKDWINQDNQAILRGATFDIDLLTDNGMETQETIFAPDGLPIISSVSGEIYTVRAKLIVRSYTEQILPGSFDTPENAFSYYFYSQYQYPDSLRLPLLDGYSKSDANGFSINGLTSGSYVARIDSDDIYTTFSLKFIFDATESAIFRAWLAQDSFNMLKGAAFNIPLITEYGVILQVVRFADGGYPQLTADNGRTVTYTAEVMARTQINDINGLDDAIFGPQVFSTLLYPFFAETDSMNFSSSAKAGGGLSEPYQDAMAFGSVILSGGKVGSVVINYEQVDPESLSFGSSILIGGIVKTAVINYDSTTFDTERIDFSSSILAGGIVKTVAIRYDSATFDTDNLNFSSAILAGGSVGA